MGIFRTEGERKLPQKKEEHTKSEAAGDLPGEHHGSDIKESSPSTAQTAGA